MAYQVHVKTLQNTRRPKVNNDGVLLRDKYLEMSLYDIYVDSRLPEECDEVIPAEYTTEFLTDDKKRKGLVRATETREAMCKYREAIVVYLFGRERVTGLSVSVQVITWARVVIELPDSWKASREHVQRLYVIIEGLIGYMEERAICEKEKMYKYRPKKKKQEIECFIEFHKKSYGFHPGESVGSVAEFPFAIVYSNKGSTLDYIKEAVYGKVDDEVKDWRLAEIEADTCLQFLDASGLTSCSDIKIDLERVMVQRERFYTTTDIELCTTFRPQHFTLAHESTAQGGVCKSERGRVSVFSKGTDLVTIGRKKVAFFDIEAVTPRPKGFPSASNPSDEIICFAVAVYDGTDAYEGCVFSLPGVSHVPTPMEETHRVGFFTYKICENERDLLERVRDYIVVIHDCDAVTGWNSSGFDWPYVRDRMKILDMDKGQSRSTYMSRFVRRHCSFKSTRTSSAAHGTRIGVSPVTPGIVHFDMMVFISKRFKYDEYSLSSVAQKLLGEDKIDLKAEEMFKKWLSGDPAQRREVAVYNAKDCLLPLEIWRKLLLDAQITAQARVCTVLYRDIMNKGELMKSFSLLYVVSHSKGYILNEDPRKPVAKAPTWKTKRAEETMYKEMERGLRAKKSDIDRKLKEVRERLARPAADPSYSTHDRTRDGHIRDRMVLEQRACRLNIERLERGEWEEGEEEEAGASEKRYQGAKVLPPVVGIHCFVAVLDFYSLYPNIIIGSNICPSCIVYKEDVEDLRAKGWNINCITLEEDEKAYFQTNIAGIVPEICASLLSERQRAKRQKAEAYRAGDVALAEVRDGEQLALKVVANSEYGSLGAPEKVSKYSSMLCARAVTGRGRDLIALTKEQSEKQQDTKVVYDIKNRDDRIKEILRTSQKLAEDLTAFFGGPIVLEFEKLYLGFCLISKKRYFGMKIEKLGDTPKMDSKGVQSVRRSTNTWNKKFFTALQHFFVSPEWIWSDFSSDRPYVIVQDELRRVLDGRVDVMEFARSCRLADSYQAPQAQTVVRDKIRERAPGSEPQPGDRIMFAMARPKDVNAKGLEMAECVFYMKEHNIPIATHYYIKLAKTTIVQLFEIVSLDYRRVESIFDRAIDEACLVIKSQKNLEKYFNVKQAAPSGQAQPKVEPVTRPQRCLKQTVISKPASTTKTEQDKEFFKQLHKRRKKESIERELAIKRQRESLAAFFRISSKSKE